MKNFLLIALLFCISSCRYQDHVVQIFPYSPPLEFSYKYNQRMDLSVVDNRVEKKFVGIKFPIFSNMNEERKDPSYFIGRQAYENKIAILSTSNDLSKFIKQKFLRNLGAKGFALDEGSINKLRIEILELNVVSNSFKNRASSKIKVMASNGVMKTEKIYDLKVASNRPLHDMIYGPFGPGSNGGYYDDMIINESIDNNIEQILRDDNIWTLFRNHIAN